MVDEVEVSAGSIDPAGIDTRRKEPESSTGQAPWKCQGGRTGAGQVPPFFPYTRSDPGSQLSSFKVPPLTPGVGLFLLNLMLLV